MRLVFVVLVNFVLCAHGANILGIFSHAGKSHVVLGEKLLRSMAKRGHTVTMLSPFPLKDKVENYTDIYIDETKVDYNKWRANGIFDSMLKDTFSPTAMQQFTEFLLTQCEALFLNKQVQQLMKSEQKFDLVVMDYFVNDPQIVFGHIFDCPVILMASYGSSPLTNHIIGNPAPYAYVPSPGPVLPAELGFFDRLVNTLVYSLIGWNIYSAQSDQQKILDRYVEGAPSINELYDRVAAVFTNEHVSFKPVHPSVPNEISIGGFHVGPTKALPRDLQTFLDGAKDGAVFFSLGGNMKSAFLGEKRIKEILVAFSKLKQRVLWKFEVDNAENLPKNVMISKWFPQNDVLAHPNVKLFVTHGGLLSTIESVHHGVPMIGIPFFGDQNSNVAYFAERGFGLHLPQDDITGENLLTKINEILNNPKYQKAISKASELLRDQQTPPLEKAVYWTEHIIRHGGDHLKNNSKKLHWFQYMLLDVMAFIAFVLAVVGFVLFKSFCVVLRLVNSSRSIDTIKKKTN